jgi:hypothetical protein
MHLAFVFALGNDMTHLNNNNNNNNHPIAATIFILAVAIIVTLLTTTMTTTIAPAAATTTAETATTPASSSGLELSPQPVLRERQISLSQTPINQTHILFTDSGNGTVTLPNTTEAINFTGTDSVIVSTIDGTAVGKEVFTTLDGSESVNGTVFGIARFNMEEGTGRAIIILLLHTNSTGRLAPVDGMILAGHIEFYPDGSAESTMWEWQSGVPLPTTTTTTPEEPPLMNTTRTNATADTNAAAPEEEGEGNEEGEDPNEFEDCVVPPGRDPGDVGC